MEICAKCGSKDIRQEITFMFDPNNPPATLALNDGTCEDFYYCVDCGPTWTKEVKEDS